MIHSAEIEKELRNILSFWTHHTVDEQNGGFVGEILSDMSITPNAPKGLVLNARILWAFSKAYRFYKDKQYKAMADRAYRYLNEYFLDPEYAGYYWMVDVQGKPLNSRKQIYGQAFAVYAFSEYYMAVRNTGALDKAKEIFHLIEAHSYDHENKGYFEACTQNWKLEEDMRLSEHDMNEKKSMNTHLHVLEAYTNLYRIWPDETLRQKLAELIEVTVDRIVNQKSGHFILFFDESWNTKSDLISYGHDIEGSWLLYEAADALNDEALKEQVKSVALQMAEAVYNNGLDADGSVLNEANSQGVFDDDKHWWPQAEAVVGFLNAYQLNGNPDYLTAAEKCWTFIDKYIIDKKHGEWFWKVSRTGEPYLNSPKVDPWKCPYHNSRACFEILERLEHINL